MGRHRRNFAFLQIRDPERTVSPSLRDAEGTHAPAFSQFRRQPVWKRRARIVEVFQQRQAGLIFRRQIPNPHAIVQRQAGGADARQDSRRGKPGAEEKAAHEGKGQKRQQQREGLVVDGVLDVHARRAGGHQTRDRAKPRAREAPPRPVPQATRDAIAPIEWLVDEGHAGTRNFLTASSTTPRAVTPEKRACGSSTSRWAMTGTASF